MYNFNDVVQTTKKRHGENSCKYIIIHHTGGGSYASNLRILSGNAGLVSVHFVIGPKGECAKIGTPADILSHTGKSQWGKDVDDYGTMNKLAMGIEVVGPDKDGLFSNQQFAQLVSLVRYLQTTFKIPKENVLCHHDITWAGSKDMKLRDGKSACRKPDISRTLRSERGFKSFDDFRTKELV